MKNILIIGTTAINRSVLHNDVIPDWIKWINNINKESYKIIWFINIDIIEKLNETYEETKDNFIKLNNEKFEINFLKSEECKGNFLKACQRVSKNIKKYIDNLNLNDDFKLQNIKIIWLEDDWKLNINTNININEIINNYSSPYSHINLSFIRNNYIWALAPSIISYKLWLDLFFEAWDKQAESIDPESCVGLYYRKKYGNPDNIKNLTISYTETKKKNLNYMNSYYTYHSTIIQSDKDNEINDNEINDKFIKYSQVKNFFNNEILFIRITPKFCVDYGRNFMEKYNLKKIGQNVENTDLYNLSNQPL